MRSWRCRLTIACSPTKLLALRYANFAPLMRGVMCVKPKNGLNVAWSNFIVVLYCADGSAFIRSRDRLERLLEEKIMPIRYRIPPKDLANDQAGQVIAGTYPMVTESQPYPLDRIYLIWVPNDLEASPRHFSIYVFEFAERAERGNYCGYRGHWWKPFPLPHSHAEVPGQALRAFLCHWCEEMYTGLRGHTDSQDDGVVRNQ